MNYSKLENRDEMPTISIQNTEQMWDILSGKLDEFYQAWELKSPPDLEKFVPLHPLALRRFALNELIKVDMEQRLENDCPPKSLKDYLQQFPELLRNGKVDADLLFEEIELRKKFRLDLQLDEYQRLLPDQAETLQKLLGGEKTTQSIFPARRNTFSLNPGSQVDDFELLLELGKGAFATVFLARQLSMQRVVALKVSKDRGDEPKTLAQLDCKNVVRVYDVRDIDDPRCRLLYMKFVAGGSLHDVIQRMKTIPLSERNGAAFLSVVDEKAGKSGQDIPLDSRTRQRLLEMEWFELVFWLGSEIASGLAYAHRVGVLHRDLKPANILLTTEGIPQIADFNVSFCSEVEGASAEAFFGGSLAYMSPEQLQAFDPEHERSPADLSEASDIYSLGIILWELMFGARPFPDQMLDDDYSKLLGQLFEQRSKLDIGESLPEDSRQVDVDLVETFDGMLRPEVEQRLDDAQGLAGELALLSDRESRALLRPPKTRLAYWLQRAIPLFVVIAVVIPSALAARFNYLYNYFSIIEPKGEKFIETFNKVQKITNYIAFPLGISLLVFLSVRLQLRLTRKTAGAKARTVRKHVLQMPLTVVIVPLAIWTICGMTYPVAMYIGQAPITLSDSFHFLTSLILCGLIASVYPFFIVSYVAIRFWYPAAFTASHLMKEDQAQIDRLIQRVWFFMSLGVLLPTFSILLMVMTQQQNDQFLLALLAGSSFIALGIVFVLFQKLQHHLNTVKETIGKIIENRL